MNCHDRRWLLASAATLAMLVATTASAQQTPPKKPPASSAAAANEEGTEVESVVVTGSFLRGTPETATIPVEGYNLESIRDQGSPSNMDFVKGLSEIGQVFGESNRAATLGNGQQTINLRSLGASRTVVVFNGRRMNEEYSFGLGRSNNIATIPNCAIGRVEILKDGGGTTYGADAVGGVVNYITRKGFDGVEAQAQYRYIKGSDGDYNACISLGKKFDKGDVEGFFGYLHRSRLPVTERDWAFQPFLRNPGAWYPAAVVPGVNNPGSYQLVQNAAALVGQQAPNLAMTPSGVSPLLPLLTYQATNDLQFGTQGGVRDPACNALGGYNGWIAFGTGAQPACMTPNGYFENLVEESDIFQAYLEGNWRFSDKFRVHGEFQLYWLDIPNIPLDAFTASVAAWPLQRDASGNIVNCAPNALTCPTPRGVSQTVSTVGAFLVPSYAPAVKALLDNFKNSNGTNVLSSAQYAAWTSTALNSPYSVALPINTWRPFGLGGGALDGDVDTQDNRSIQYTVNLGFSGDIGKFAGGEWDWKLDITHGWAPFYKLTAPDIWIDRLQAALKGFGGANCTGTTPGANGCKYFNPFSSAYQKNVVTGAVNPYYNAALKNDRDLVEWLYTEVEVNYPSEFDVIDALLRSDFDYHLWSSDPIQLAVGAQYRERHQRVDTTDIGDTTKTPCATVGYMDCVTRGGPTLFQRWFYISGTTQDYDRRYPVEAAFAEVKIPITDKLNTQLSTRWEKYFSDLGGQDNSVIVSGGGIRYQFNENIALRATGQQSFSQANPLAPLPDVVTVVNAIPGTYGGATGANYQTNNVANPDVKPERGFNYNIGGVFQIGSSVTATLDYYNISIKSVIDPGGLSANTVINAVAVPGQTGVTTQIQCGSPLITEPQAALGGRAYFQLPSGFTCVQGVTTVADALLGVQTQDPTRTKVGTPIISYFGAQGQERRTYNGGSLDTSGVDAKVTWRAPSVMDGDLTLTGDLSYILTYDVGQYRIAGIPYSIGYDGIGYVNNGSQRPGGQRIYPWRGSITANYHRGRHNFNWSTRIITSITNNDIGLINGSAVPSATQNANIGDANGFVSSSCPTGGNIFAPPVPDAAGTGVYGNRVVVGGAFAVGYNPCQNVAITNGDKLGTQFTSSFTWRMQLPQNLDLTLTVDNVFDTDPQFSRDTLNYDSSSGVSPLGRTFQIGVRKTF